MVGKVKGFTYFIIVLFGFTAILFSLETMSYSVQLNEHNKSTSIVTHGEFFLCDSYDSKTSSMTDFLNQKDSYDILLKTYRAVKQNRKLNYYEFSRQYVEVCGRFKGNEKFCAGNDSECLNQKVNGTEITALKSLQADARFFKDYGILQNTESGTVFDGFNHDSNTIPSLPSNNKNIFGIKMWQSVLILPVAVLLTALAAVVNIRNCRRRWSEIKKAKVYIFITNAAAIGAYIINCTIFGFYEDVIRNAEFWIIVIVLTALSFELYYISQLQKISE